MQPFLITFVGKDRPGIVEHLSRLIMENKGSWEQANLSKLAGSFAGIIQISLAEQDIARLRDALQEVNDLTCTLSSLDGDVSSPAELTLGFKVTGNDRPGILHQVSAAIQSAGGNITSIKSYCRSSPNWGGQLFTAHVEVAATEKNNAVAIIHQLEQVSDDIVVDQEEVAN